MSEDAQNAFTVTVLPPAYSPPATELKDVSSSGGAFASDSSTEDNNVSFINITYTIPPHPLKTLFKHTPPKKILDDVR